MKSRTWLTAALLAIYCNLAFAGQPGPALSEKLPRSQRGVSVPVDPPLNKNLGAVSWRWVGIKPAFSQPCPDPGFWRVSDMFFIDSDSPPIPLVLRNYCLYEAPPGATVTDSELFLLKDLLGQGALTALDPDVLAVSPLASDLGDATVTVLQDHFLGQAGAAQPLPLFNAPPVRYAFIDTAPTNESNPLTVPGNSTHGFTLMNAADRLLCGGFGAANCATRLTSRLGLAYVCFDPFINRPSCRDEVNGGYVGIIGEMAQAIRAETDSWGLNDPAGTRLVINISAAWQGLFGGAETDPADMPTPVQAVYDALQEASCRGVLVFAAAGNRHGGPNEAGGPLYPAAWERVRAPSFSECIRLLGGSPSPDVPPDYLRVARPMIHAVGGVNAADEPLANALAAAEPRLVAFGDHVSVEASLFGFAAGTLTGSSVATMVVSATAAAGVYYRFDLAPYSIVEQMYAKGRPLGRGAQVCLSDMKCTERYEVRRIKMCDALADICATGDCPPSEVFDCQAETPLSFNGIALPPFDNPGYAAQIDAADLTESFPQSSTCGPENLLHRSGITPNDPCPDKQYHGELAEPWVNPQPGWTACPSCSVRGSSARGSAPVAALLLEIDDTFLATITEAVLRCDSDAYHIPVADLVGTLGPGDRLRMTGVGACVGSPKAEITFTVAGPNGSASTTSPLLLVDDT